MVTVGTVQVDLPLDAIAAICRRYQVRELSVFGFALRDDFREDSDIDLLVEFDPEARFGLFTYFELRDELAEVLGRPVDLVEKSGVKQLIGDEILSSAQVVYAE